MPKDFDAPPESIIKTEPGATASPPDAGGIQTGDDCGGSDDDDKCEHYKNWKLQGKEFFFNIEKKDKRIAELDGKRKELHVKNGDLQTEINDLKYKLKESATYIESARTNNAELRAKNKRLTDRVENLEREEKDKKAALAKEREEFEQEKKEYLNNRKTKLDTDTTDFQRRKRDLDERETVLKTQKAKLDRRETTLASDKEEFERGKKDLEKRETALANAKISFDKDSLEFEILKTDLKKRETALATAQSMFDRRETKAKQEKNLLEGKRKAFEEQKTEMNRLAGMMAQLRDGIRLVDDDMSTFLVESGYIREEKTEGDTEGKVEETPEGPHNHLQVLVGGPDQNRDDEMDESEYSDEAMVTYLKAELGDPEMDEWDPDKLLSMELRNIPCIGVKCIYKEYHDLPSNVNRKWACSECEPKIFFCHIGTMRAHSLLMHQEVLARRNEKKQEYCTVCLTVGKVGKNFDRHLGRFHPDAYFVKFGKHYVETSTTPRRTRPSEPVAGGTRTRKRKEKSVTEEIAPKNSRRSTQPKEPVAGGSGLVTKRGKSNAEVKISSDSE